MLEHLFSQKRSLLIISLLQSSPQRPFLCCLYPFIHQGLATLTKTSVHLIAICVDASYGAWLPLKVLNISALPATDDCC